MEYEQFRLNTRRKSSPARHSAWSAWGRGKPAIRKPFQWGNLSAGLPPQRHWRNSVDETNEWKEPAKQEPKKDTPNIQEECWEWQTEEYSIWNCFRSFITPQVRRTVRNISEHVLYHEPALPSDTGPKSRPREKYAYCYLIFLMSNFAPNRTGELKEYPQYWILRKESYYLGQSTKSLFPNFPQWQLGGRKFAKEWTVYSIICDMPDIFTNNRFYHKLNFWGGIFIPIDIQMKQRIFICTSTTSTPPLQPYLIFASFEEQEITTSARGWLLND